MTQRCAESDAWRADIHNCDHTNACNKQVMGTRLFCYAIPGKGYDACKAVFNELAPLTPGTSENVQKNPNLYEVRTPAAPTVYCECEFQDTAEGAKWIVEHTTEIGEAIAKGLCKYLGVTFVPAKAEEKPVEAAPVKAEPVVEAAKAEEKPAEPAPAKVEAPAAEAPKAEEAKPEVKAEPAKAAPAAKAPAKKPTAKKTSRAARKKAAAKK